MGGLKRVLIAAAVGLAAVAVPVGSAQAAGEVAPTYDPGQTVVNYPGISALSQSSLYNGQGSVTVKLINTGGVNVSLQNVTKPMVEAYAYEKDILDAAGNSYYGSGIPAGGALLETLQSVPGTYTWTFNWIDTGITGSWTGSTAVTVTIPDAPPTSIALASTTPDSGQADGSAFFTVCSPDKALIDHYASIQVDKSIYVSVPDPVLPSLCATAKVYGLSAGNHEAVLTGSYVPSSVSSPGTPLAFSIGSVAAPNLNVVQAPSVGGTARVGSTVKVSGGSFSPAASAVSYQWLRNGVAIKGATKTSYKLTVKDYNKSIKIRITGTAATYSATSSTSAGVKVAAGPSLKRTGTPKVSGTAKVGKTLKVSKGKWTPKASKYSYQWLRNGSGIKNATKASYKLTAADKGKKISCKVTAKATGYGNGVFTTKAVGAVK